MQRKIFPFVRGVRGGPQPPSEDQFCEKYFWVFQGEKIVFSKVAQNDVRSKKNIDYTFFYAVGGVIIITHCYTFFFYFSTINNLK